VSAAWKLRAVVYGMLAVVAALLLVPRFTSSGESRSGPVRTVETLEGYTVQHQWIRLTFIGGRLNSVASSAVLIRCGRRRANYYWRLTRAQADVDRQHGSAIELRQVPAGNFVEATLSRDGHRIDGVIGYVNPACKSGPVRFSASR
jgi:hypothetical protein